MCVLIFFYLAVVFSAPWSWFDLFPNRILFGKSAEGFNFASQSLLLIGILLSNYNVDGLHWVVVLLLACTLCRLEPKYFGTVLWLNAYITSLQSEWLKCDESEERHKKKKKRTHSHKKQHLLLCALVFFHFFCCCLLLWVLFFFNLFSTVNGILWKIYAFSWHGTAINSETNINAITKTKDALHEISLFAYILWKAFKPISFLRFA